MDSSNHLITTIICRASQGTSLLFQESLSEVTSEHVRNHLFTQMNELIIEPLIMSKLTLVSCVVLLD